MSRARPGRVAAFPKHFATLFALFLIGCSSGSGCSSCSGITPLPAGFEPSKTIENAGSARLTASGIQFLQDNIGTLAGALFSGMGTGGVVSLKIPDSGSISGPLGSSYELCPSGSGANQCLVEVDLGNAALTIASQSPHDLVISGKVPVHLDLPINVKEGLTCSIDATLTGDGSCGPATKTSFAKPDLTLDISLEVDTNQAHARYGYTVIKIANLDIPASDLSSALNLCSTDSDPLCGFLSDIVDSNAVKSFIISQFHDTLMSALESQISQQLCQKADTTVSPSCPTGSSDVSGTCQYSDGTCVSTMLGTDGHANLGALLASLSPGTKGGLDFLFAAGGQDPNTSAPSLAWGDLDPGAPPDGATIGLFGGAEPKPTSKCVKLSDIHIPSGIPIPDELFQDTVTGWPAATPGPHLGLAVSERFTNYALNSVYNSGMLCIGITTDAEPLLKSGLVSLLIPSMKNLGIQRESQELGIVIRPSSPPTVKFGNGTNLTTDPLIDVKLNQASLDFYIFSTDRFIRFMTATYDLDVPLNLTVGPNGLTPALNTIGVTNGKVTNSALLSEDPAKLASLLGGLISGMVGQAVGSGLPTINLNTTLASFGLELDIPDTVAGQGSPGLRKLTKANDNYLGIFAAFGLANGPMPVKPIETSAEVVRKNIDPAGLKIDTMALNNGPDVRVHFSSPSDDGTTPIEYAYRLDNGFWHPYSSERMVDVNDEYLRLQGRHTLFVRSRIVGQPKTLDPTPAEVPILVDIDPPTVKVGSVRDDGTVELTIRDTMSDEGHSFVRTRLDGGDWSAWQLVTEGSVVAVGKATTLDVEAKDEEGNVGVAHQALLRGRAQAGAAACGCVAAGDDSTPRGTVWLFAAALSGLAARLARSRRKTVKATKAASAESDVPGPRAVRIRSAILRGSAVAAVLGMTFSWAGCSCGSDTGNGASTTGGGEGGNGPSSDCKAPDCQTLEPGLIGAYSSAAVSGTTIWFSGYAEANWEEGYTWGDLVVGKWNGKSVAWKTVDGVPSTPKVNGKLFNTKGFRGGQTAPGDDVGIWTSIGLDAKGEPAVAYFDRTNKRLRFARQVGGAWDVTTVDSKASSEVGRYAKLLANGGGWAIAYQSIEPGGDNGAAVSRVRLATTTTSAPSPSDWTIEDVAVDTKTPCRVQFCKATDVCNATTELCVTPLDSSKCNPACASSTACLDDGTGAGACVNIWDTTKLDTYPDAIGDYIAIAALPAGGIGVAYYDRVNGNLMVASKASGAWTTTLVDGQTKTGTDTGDVGIGASLFVDTAGTWHLSYVNGITEALTYVELTSDLKIGKPETIDNGLSVNGTSNTDGQHLVGDDSNLVVLGDGSIHVSYQDATAGTLHYAVGTTAGSKHTWKVQVIPQSGFAGAFSHVLVVQGNVEVANWWRKGGGDVNHAVGDIAIVKP